MIRKIHVMNNKISILHLQVEDNKINYWKYIIEKYKQLFLVWILLVIKRFDVSGYQFLIFNQLAPCRSSEIQQVET